MSMWADFYPWQTELASSWLAQPERFAHAWLVHGVPGIGKRNFALAAAASMLCHQPRQGLACGQCTSCQWISSGNHPDLRRLRPDATAQEEGAPDTAGLDATSRRRQPSKEIRIDQLRELQDWFALAPHQGGWRVLVLYPAQALNVVSANALLKILEEPGPQTLFILVADAPDQLLPTIVSRCRRLPLPVPDKQDSLRWLQEQGIEQAEAWLAAASHAPVAAFRLAQDAERPFPDWLETWLKSLAASASLVDVGAIADQLERLTPSTWLGVIQRANFDMQLQQAGLPAHYYPGLHLTAQVASRVHARSLSQLAQWLARQQRIVDHPLSERLFIQAVLERAARAWQA